jgi:hypothetical protein
MSDAINGLPDFGRTEIAMRTADHAAYCDECGRSIEPGEQYEHVRYPEAEETGDTGHLSCADCLSLRKEFFRTYIYGSLRSEMVEFIGAGADWQDIPYDRLAKLTPAAREWVCGLIEAEWAEQDVDDPVCRVCGCTWDRGCPGGCWWVVDPEGKGDLCSACCPDGEAL